MGVLLTTVSADAGCQQGEGLPLPGATAAREALLRHHHAIGVAHRLGDATALVALHDSGFVEISNGRVTVPTGAQTRAIFEEYFASVHFLEWDDLVPPRVRVVPGGEWGEVIVQKRIRGIPADTVAHRTALRSNFAWVERWRRTAEGWRLALVASSSTPQPEEPAATLHEQTQALTILRRARVALGGEAAVANVAMLRFRADCSSPAGPYVTTVASARDGRVSFVQEFPDQEGIAAGISLAGPWQQSGNAPRMDSLPERLRSVITAHEMHLLAIAPESRYSRPVAVGRRDLNGTTVETVRFQRAAGGPVDFFFDSATGLPAGFQPVLGGNGTPLVTRFADWRRVGAILLPFVVTVTHGDDRFEYRMVEVAAEWLTDQSFQPLST